MYSTGAKEGADYAQTTSVKSAPSLPAHLPAQRARAIGIFFPFSIPPTIRKNINAQRNSSMKDVTNNDSKINRL